MFCFWAIPPEEGKTPAPLIHGGASGYAFHACFHGHARRLRLEKLLCLGLSRSPSGHFTPLLDPGGGFKTADLEFKWPSHGRFESETVMAGLGADDQKSA
jgi:hypothetical protein